MWFFRGVTGERIGELISHIRSVNLLGQTGDRIGKALKFNSPSTQLQVAASIRIKMETLRNNDICGLLQRKPPVLSEVKSCRSLPGDICDFT